MSEQSPRQDPYRRLSDGQPAKLDTRKTRSPDRKTTLAIGLISVFVTAAVYRIFFEDKPTHNPVADPAEQAACAVDTEDDSCVITMVVDGVKYSCLAHITSKPNNDRADGKDKRRYATGNVTCIIDDSK